MTIVERNNKLKHLITCLKCEVSGKVCDENCSTQYDAGNMGEIIENLEAISRVLEQEPVLDKILNKILEKCFDVPYGNQAFDYGLKIVKWSDVREILDKYKAESEE